MKSDKQEWHDYISETRSNTNIDLMVSSMYDERLATFYDKLERLRSVYGNLLSMSYGNVKRRGSPTVIIKYILPNFKNKHEYGTYGFKLQCLITGGKSKPIQLNEYEQYGIDDKWQDTGGPFQFELDIPNTIEPALSEYYKHQSTLFRKIRSVQEKYINDARNIINANWKMRYSEYLNSPEWREVRKEILTIDIGICLSCKSKENLQVHHMTYENVGAELHEDLITLCRSCHVDIHKMEYDNRKILEAECVEFRNFLRS